MSDTEREAFEAWAYTKGYPIGRAGNGYINNFTGDAYAAWMARAATQPAAPEPPESLGVPPAGSGYPLRPAAFTAIPNAWTNADDALPPDETPVLIVRRGSVRVGELRWDHPFFEDTYRSHRYWDDPENDGQDWEFFDVTHWMPLPAPPARGIECDSTAPEGCGPKAEEPGPEGTRPDSAVNAQLLEALTAARAWMKSAGHGDNCFLHDDGGEYDACFCGLDSALSAIDEVLEVAAIAAATQAKGADK